MLTSLSAVIVFLLMTSETLDSSGKLVSAGAPGESSCSNTGCHGAGNGNSTSGGLADNAGPGSISLTAVPAFTNNKYVPGTTYNMTITVSETGKSLFGFSFESLDNSGNTSLMVNNSTGTIIVTDAVRTRTAQTFGTGRLSLTHKTNGGAVQNAANFVFSWKAPATGTVNFYYDGVAANSNAIEDAGDNVYKNSLQLTPFTGSATAVPLNSTTETSFLLFPNPAREEFTISFNQQDASIIKISLMDINGRVVRSFEKKSEAGVVNETYPLHDLPAGLYFVKVNTGKKTLTRKFVIAD